MIELKGISKAFGQTGVFDSLDMTLKKGKIYSLMGPSGQGKTTFLRILAGLEKPDEGTIDGLPERISMIFQEDRLCEGLSPVENISLVMNRCSRCQFIEESEKNLILGKDRKLIYRDMKYHYY